MACQEGLIGIAQSMTERSAYSLAPVRQTAYLPEIRPKRGWFRDSEFRIAIGILRKAVMGGMEGPKIALAAESTARRTPMPPNHSSGGHETRCGGWSRAEPRTRKTSTTPCRNSAGSSQRVPCAVAYPAVPYPPIPRHGRRSCTSPLLSERCLRTSKSALFKPMPGIVTAPARRCETPRTHRVAQRRNSCGTWR